jgi:hypothetical protein
MTRVHGWTVLAIALALSAGAAADSKGLVRVAMPAGDFHDPLYVRSDSIHWKGAVVSFNYVLDVPILGKSAEPPRFRSNEIEAIIDCAAQTISYISAFTWSGAAGTGEMGFGYAMTAQERRPERIDMRAGSTNGYLFRHLCKR